MRTRSGAPADAAAMPTTGRELRPRQAAGSRGLPAGATTPKKGGRVTRSTAVLAQSNPTTASPATSTTRKTRKRSASPNITARTRRTKRTRTRSVFYGEDSDSDSGDGPDNVDISDSEVEQSKLHQAAGPKKPSPATPTRAAKRRPTVFSAKKSQVTKEDKTVPQLENVFIPNWASLPYHVLTPVFRYAAALLEEADRAKWLSAASGVCRSFADPALTVLYESPPLLSRSMAHGLVSLLSQDPDSTRFNYRPKVEELWIGVEEIASKAYKGQPFDLVALISNLPRLKNIQFYHSKDDPPYRSLDDSLRWSYPPVLFQALNGTRGSAEEASISPPTKLTEWQWNRRLMGPDLDLGGIKELHQTPAFLSLKKVSFLNYQVPSLHANKDADDDELAARDRPFIQSMADAINALPALEFLSIESSTVVNGELLQLLPKSLKVLELVNCWDVNGDDFASYLLSSGYKLEHLILRHNQSLSLSFLTVLGAACPNLQTLRMDFKTFNHHEFYHDSDPSYENLLTADQIPTWPATLKTLELKNMRKWTAEAAETLFQSLVDSAPNLLKLRRLDLKAMLDIPYRQRSQIRDKWEAKLKQVFLRKKEDPLPFFSLRKPQQQTNNEKETAGKTAAGKSRRSARAALAAESPSRFSSRIAMHHNRASPSSRGSSVGRGLRDGLGRPSYVDPDSDEDEEGDEDDNDNDGGDGDEEKSSVQSGHSRNGSASPGGLFCHGMCEKVEIQLDNQKPAEETFGMEDFLDDAADDLSDEEWNGDDEDVDVGYAW